MAAFRWSSIGRAVQVGLLTVALLGGQASGWPASAGNWGSNRTHPCDNDMFSECIAKDGVTYYYLGYLDGALAAELATDTRDRFANVYDPIDSFDVAAVEFSNASSAGVWVKDVNIDVDARAWTRCADGVTPQGSDPYRWCEPQVVAYNDGDHPVRFDSPNKRKRIACQEIGHTYGLRHALDASNAGPDFDKSCMYEQGGLTTNLTITTHDKNQIENLYVP